MGLQTTETIMALLEFNIKAKKKQDDFAKRIRRNDMAVWRKMKTIKFISEFDFATWLNYTKWHKRPWIAEWKDDWYMVTFLDNMKGAK